MKYLITIFIILISFNFLFADQKPGSITGKVVDKKNLQPLVGANVVIEGTNRGAATDLSGKFIIDRLQAGSYKVKIFYLGYITVKKGNVIVNPNRSTVLEVPMEETALEVESVEVTASYFQKPKEAVVSTRSMDFEEIRRSPGDLVDIQRAVQALPAVVSGSDQMNEIIVRGGIPGENLFIMDNIEIPNPNHFAIQGAGGGPINMLNSYMVRNIDFYAGAFSAKYGDKASSVMDISLRNGSTERFRAEGSLGMAGIGVLAEGPLSSNGSSFIFSARKSYLDLIISSTGLTAVPKYYNLQGKMTLNLDPKNTLYINSVYGNDNIKIEEGDEAGYGRGAENVDSKNSQYVLGLTLRSFWTKNLYSLFTLSGVSSDFFADVYEKPAPNVKDTYFTNDSREGEYTLKSDFVLQAHKNLELNFGASMKSVQFDYDLWNDADTLFEYDYLGANPDAIIDAFKIYPFYRVDRKFRSFKSALYTQLSLDFLKHFRLTSGLRYEYFNFNGFASISPRLGFSYFINPKMTFNLAYGKHYQSPAYIELAANPLNDDLKSKFTEQYVTGLDYLFRDDIKLVLEAYYKTYDDVPINKTLTTVDPYDFNDQRYVNAGTGESKGFELFFQKKITAGFPRSSAIPIRYLKPKIPDSIPITIGTTTTAMC
ncbi:MAG TPA: TonB-dependent receptor [bacterium]